MSDFSPSPTSATTPSIAVQPPQSSSLLASLNSPLNSPVSADFLSGGGFARTVSTSSRAPESGLAESELQATSSSPSSSSQQQQQQQHGGSGSYPVNSFSFAENFWGVEDNGFAGFTRLVAQMRKGRKETSEIVDYLKEFAQIEEEYAKKLNKLSKTALNPGGFGAKPNSNTEAPTTLRTAWDGVHKLTENLFQQHHEASNAINEICQEIAKKREDDKKRTILHCNNVEGVQKTLLQLRTNVPKLKKQYEAKCKELETTKEEHTELNQQHLGPKEEKTLQKLTEKKIKLQKEVDAADAAYKQEVEKLAAQHDIRESEITRAANDFEGSELLRIYSLRIHLTQFLDVLKRFVGNVSHALIDANLALDCVKPENDVEIFVSSMRTGWTRETPLAYENFYTGHVKVGAFGVDLQTHLNQTEREIPYVVEESIRYIESRGLKDEGLYRLPGRAAKIRDLRNFFDNVSESLSVPLDTIETQVSDVASLLKMYLRELPDPVTKCEHYEAWVQCGENKSDDRVKTYKMLVNKLPSGNKATLQHIIRHLNRVVENAESNKMNASNLGIVLGPSLVHSTSAGNITDFARQAKVIEDLMFFYDDIFA